MFCAGLRRQQQSVASGVSIWSVWCAVSSRVESGARSDRWTSFRWPVLNNCRRFSEGASSSTNRFQTPFTSHRSHHHRSGGPPDFVPLEDRRMEWSLVHPSSFGNSPSWTCQQLCLSCSMTIRFEDVRKHRAQNADGILELFSMSPPEMSDACALCASVSFLFQSSQFLGPIGSRVDHPANRLFCIVWIRPCCPSLAKAPSLGCFVRCPFLLYLP